MRRWGALSAITAVLATLLYMLLVPPAPPVSPGEAASAGQRADQLQAAAANLGPQSPAALTAEPTGATGASAPEEEEEDLPGTVSLRGQVTDERGQPLAGVRVRVWPSNNFNSRMPPKAGRRTDEQGRFRFASFPPALYELAFDRERYLPQKLKAYPLTANPEPLTLQLQRSPTVEGRVVDASGSPLPEVTVELQRAEWMRSFVTDEGDVVQFGKLSKPAFTRASDTVTGPDGTFILDAPESDELRVRAVREGFTPVERAVTAPARDVWLVLGTGASVELTVVDEQDRPVPGARVDLWSGAEERNPQVAATTNEAGQVALRGLEPGHYTLIAIPPSGQGLRLASTELRIREPESRRVRLRFEAGVSLSGLVVDPSGQPIAGVTVRAQPRDASDAGAAWLELALTRVGNARDPSSHTTSTGPDGRFTLPHLLPMKHRVSFHKQGYLLLGDDGVLLVTPGPGSVRAVLRYVGRVSGRVVRADGEPVTSFRLNDEPRESPDGTFTDVPDEPGTNRLRVFVPGVGGVLREYESREGQDVDLGDLVVGDGRPVLVRMVEEASSLPVTGTRPWFQEEPGGRLVHPREFGYQSPTRGAEGSTLLLPDVPARPFTILVEHHGYEAAKVPLGADQHEVTVRLRAWATLRGQVRVGGQPLAHGRVNFYEPEEGHEGFLRVRDGEFSGRVVHQGRFVAIARCDGCPDPAPVFLNQLVDVPAPGQTLTLEFDARAGGATVDVRTFTSRLLLGLVPGQHPQPTTLTQFAAALALRHPDEPVPGEERIWRLRHVPAGTHTLLGRFFREDGSEVFLRQEVQVPPEGQVLVELRTP